MPEARFHVGNAAGFATDRVDAGVPVVKALIESGAPAALFYETLAERTLAYAQRNKMRDADKGYTPDLERFLAPVLADCVAHKIPILGNFGAANPAGAARAIHRLAKELGIEEIKVAVVEGDDVREGLRSMQVQAWEEEPLFDVGRHDIVAANAYLGARPIADALALGADVVVTGRVTDSALALAPLLHHFGWDDQDWDRVAAGVLTGHLLECGAQATGGYFADPGYKDVPDMADIGYPIAEVAGDGDIVLTKPSGTGGRVDPRTVKEQILYEIHDPANYLTPDVTLDLMQVAVSDAGPDRVQVTGAKGRPAPETLKVTISYEGGWLGEGEISYAGPGASARARLAAETAKARVEREFPGLAVRTDVLGLVSVLDGDSGGLSKHHSDTDWQDVRVRLAVNADDETTAARAAREVETLYCAGPAGGAGVRLNVMPRIKTASCLIPRESIQPRVRLVGPADV
ncbi:MAG: DUF1446 domain-containing protein [Rhodospirillaceae bacterium]|nr:DUF1446 domain-containing protein [Rhodospirillaceae bacterium]MDD9913351.1 DUF1446 domain-containing protein [Rhodospirillaceae bacterium]MDD9929573.1 DUF1446 domain-containing protein [Rhodospirillaceae bacterium]